MRKKLKELVRYPWQIPLFAVVTVYGIYRYGWLDWKVIAMFLITIIFVTINIKQIIQRKK